MKFVLNEDKDRTKEVISSLKANDGYCPCQIGKNENTKCICTDFKQNVQVGELCICELYRKIES